MPNHLCVSAGKDRLRKPGKCLLGIRGAALVLADVTRAHATPAPQVGQQARGNALDGRPLIHRHVLAKPSAVEEAIFDVDIWPPLFLFEGGPPDAR